MLSPPEGTNTGWRSRTILAAILVGTVVLRLRLLAVPLERDEGEYAYMGQLILRGEVPYLAAHNMKLPGVYYANAAILWLLGETDVGIRLGLLAVNLASIVLVHLLARRLFDATVAVAAAAAYALFSLGSGVLGFTANAEHFVVLPVVASVLLLARQDQASSPGRVAAAGLLLGVAYLMKQHGAAFVVFGGLWVLLAGRLRGVSWARVLREATLFAAAALVPFLLTCLAMYRAGAFPAFWFWTVAYAREYVSMIPLAAGLDRLADQVVHVGASTTPLWLLAAFGATALAWDPAARRRAPLLGLLLISSFAAVCPGLRFSEHYFILLLPVASLLVGVAVQALARATGVAAIGAVAALLAIVLSLVQERALLFVLTPVQVSRAFYGVNPFPEAVAIGRWLHDHTAPDERIAVIGSEPEIYFYARRRAATTYIYTYPLMEPHPFAREMQQEMIAQLEQARPRYMIAVNVDTSWSRRPDSAPLLFDWAEETLSTAYKRVGLADIVPGATTVHRWGEAAAAAPASRSHVVTFERRS